MFDKTSISVGTLIGLFSTGLLFFVISGQGQNEAPVPEVSQETKDLVERAEMERVMAQGEDAIKKLETRIDALEKALAAKAGVEDVNKALEKHAKDMNENFKALEGFNVQTAEKLKELTGNMEGLRDFVDMHGKWFNQISKMDGDKRIPSLLTNMSNEAFADQMKEVVNRSVQTEGQVIIKNETRARQVVWVNEKIKVDLPAGTTSPPVKVPTGNVSTRVEGQRLINWTIGPPKYTQRISVIERVGTVTFVYE